LPSISSRLGKKVRTNSESILGVRFPKGGDSMSGGLAGGASFYLNERTHIGVVRYPEGSDAIGLMMTPLSGGRPGLDRVLKWMLTLIRHPLRALQVHNPIGFARQTMLLLVMQTAEAHLNIRLKRKKILPFSKSFVTEGKRIPSSIPDADDFARRAAEKFGGIATTMLSEVLLNIPTTAHCMGGCVMGRNADGGVVDAKSRVFGYKNMMVCDGSVLSANLGVNPSLTITALTEHAMSHVPARSESPMRVGLR
jgi:cholesterol oxidase